MPARMTTTALGQGADQCPDLRLDLSRELAVDRKVDFVRLGPASRRVVLARVGRTLGPDLFAVLGHLALWPECWWSCAVGLRPASDKISIPDKRRPLLGYGVRRYFCGEFVFKVPRYCQSSVGRLVRDLLADNGFRAAPDPGERALAVLGIAAVGEDRVMPVEWGLDADGESEDPPPIPRSRCSAGSTRGQASDRRTVAETLPGLGP